MGQKQATAPWRDANRGEQIDVWGWTILGGHNLFEGAEMAGQRLGMHLVAMFDSGIAF